VVSPAKDTTIPYVPGSENLTVQVATPLALVVTVPIDTVLMVKVSGAPAMTTIVEVSVFQYFRVALMVMSVSSRIFEGTLGEMRVSILISDTVTANMGLVEPLYDVSPRKVATKDAIPALGIVTWKGATPIELVNPVSVVVTPPAVTLKVTVLPTTATPSSVFRVTL
jgi:hypothetical protein